MVTYETPLLEGILEDTYGVIIYQEQIMKIATVLANFSMKDADALRKAMSKKIPEELESTRNSLSKVQFQTVYLQTLLKKIYDVILRFGEYGFNKSHSTAYGLISYQTAYLKAHYLVPLFCSHADKRSKRHGQNDQIHHRMPRKRSGNSASRY